jgi:uncharacterized protein with PQ loop repeat
MSHLSQVPQHLKAYEGPIDRLVTAVAFAGPLTSLPQIYEIWFVDKSAQGVSIITWTLFIVMAAIWLCYGIAHRQKPIIISNALWIVAQALVVLGAIRFDFDWL